MTTYSYDGDGNLVSKQDPGGNCGATPQSACTTYTYDAAEQPQTITYSDGVTPNVTDMTYDSDGRRLSAVASNGTSSWAYGRVFPATTVTSDAGGCHLVQCLRVVDPETGLQYLRARYYDPTTGQFLNRDPLEPTSGTPYAYGNNDPINNVDPTGWLSWDDIGDFVDKAAPVVRRVSGVVADVAGACAIVVKAGCAQVAVGASAIKATASTYMYARRDLGRGDLLTDYAQVDLSALGVRASNRASALESRAAGVLDDWAARIASSSEWGTIPGLIRRYTTSPMLLRAGALRFRSSMWSSLNLLTDGIGLGMSGTGYLGC